MDREYEFDTFKTFSNLIVPSNTENGIFCGIDEAGCGALAGPVVASCVHLPAGMPPLDGIVVKDSKELSEKARNTAFQAITSNPEVVYHISEVDAVEIDNINIRKATFKAMANSIDCVSKKLKEKGQDVHVAFVDGNASPVEWLNNKEISVQTIIKGDQKSYSIACASILAKVHRDEKMKRVHEQFPQYEFSKNKGYGTKAHFEAINKYGPIEFVHRLSFNLG